MKEKLKSKTLWLAIIIMLFLGFIAIHLENGSAEQLVVMIMMLGDIVLFDYLKA